MELQSQTWFFVVDGGRARLLTGGRVPPGRFHVEERESIENHSEEHEHGRPSPRAGRSGNSYASEGHEDEHQLRRFAKQVVAWVDGHLARHPGGRVTLFAPPRFLGELRKLFPPALASRIDERQADLTHLSAAGLAKHPAVLELFED
jgi:protein required for attachment to host cells